MKQLGILLCLMILHNICVAQTVVIDGIPRDTSFTVHSAYSKAIKTYPHIKKVLPQLPEGVQAVENITYSILLSGRELKLNIYRLQDNKKYPALLMVHGGGWNSGDLSLQIPMAQHIAAKGYVTIPVEYRLSPEATFPGAVYDIKVAIRWIRANAEQYGIDTTKIAISGCSAGGQLAMLTGMTNFQAEYEMVDELADYNANVHAVINIDGISDFLTDELDAVRESLVKGKTPSAIKWLGGTYEDTKNLWIAASPIYHVTKHSAPVLFINSSLPRFHSGRDEIIEKLSAYNIHTEVFSFDDTPHPFWLFHPWFEPTVDKIVSFLDKTLKMKKI